MQHPGRFSENDLVSSSATKASASNVLDDHEDTPSKKRKLNNVDNVSASNVSPRFLLLHSVCADPCRSLGEVVTLLVGKNSENKDSKIIVHKNILCAASPFFEAACKQEWQGTEEGIIRLPEEQPEVIRTFVHWIYVDEYICLSFKNFHTREPADQLVGMLVKLYVLGDKYLMPRLCRDYKCLLEVPDHACKNTAKDSPLRKYLANTTVQHLSEETMYNLDEKLYPELIHDIAMHLMRAREDHKIYDPPPTFCVKYHIYESEPRVLCKEGGRNRGGLVIRK